MKRNIIIVDDFYADPQEVRDFALKQDYPDKKKLIGMINFAKQKIGKDKKDFSFEFRIK